MSRSRDLKEELDRTQVAYDESLQQQRKSFNKLQQCVDKYFWGRRAKCSGVYDSFCQAEVRSSLLEQERDKLASQLPAELSTVKSMHSTCIQRASIIKDGRDLLAKKSPIPYWLFGARNTIWDRYTARLTICERLKRTQEKLQEESEAKGPEFKK